LLEESDSDDIVKVFNVKTLQVQWEDHPGFMHVLIDTTDIIKLEEANNNIK